MSTERSPEMDAETLLDEFEHAANGGTTVAEYRALRDRIRAALTSLPEKGDAPEWLWWESPDDTRRWVRHPKLGIHDYQDDEIPEFLADSLRPGWNVWDGTIRALTAADFVGEDGDPDDHPYGGMSIGDHWWEGRARPATAAEVCAFFGIRSLPKDAHEGRMETRIEGWAKERRPFADEEAAIVSHYFAEGATIVRELDGSEVGDDDGYVRATLIIHPQRGPMNEPKEQS